MDNPAWIPIGGVDQRRLHEARLQAHHAAQWLARAARAYVPAQPDDGHTNLGWDRAVGGFATHRFKDGGYLSIGLADLTLGLHSAETDKPAEFLSLDGHGDAEARHWLGERLTARGLDPCALDATSPYQMPAHAVAQGAPYNAAALSDALAELAAWFDNAELSLRVVQQQMAARQCAASPLRCWPHHFDLATLATLPARHAAPARYVGAGLSPGDEYYDEPYFYVSVYPKPETEMLPTLPMLGHWHGMDFIAAIAPAHRIVAAKNQQTETHDFLTAAVDLAIRVLG